MGYSTPWRELCEEILPLHENGIQSDVLYQAGLDAGLGDPNGDETPYGRHGTVKSKHAGLQTALSVLKRRGEAIYDSDAQLWFPVQQQVQTCRTEFSGNGVDATAIDTLPSCGYDPVMEKSPQVSEALRLRLAELSQLPAVKEFIHLKALCDIYDNGAVSENDEAKAAFDYIVQKGDWVSSRELGERFGKGRLWTRLLNRYVAAADLVVEQRSSQTSFAHPSVLPPVKTERPHTGNVRFNALQALLDAYPHALSPQELRSACKILNGRTEWTLWLQDLIEQDIIGVVGKIPKHGFIVKDRSRAAKELTNVGRGVDLAASDESDTSILIEPDEE